MDKHSSLRTAELLQRILATHETEVDCDACGEKMDCLAELVIAGKDQDAAMQAIMAHVQCCSCCASEFHALVSILRMEEQTANHNQT